MTTKNIKKGQQLFIDYGYNPIEGIKITQRNRDKKFSLPVNMIRERAMRTRNVKSMMRTNIPSARFQQ